MSNIDLLRATQLQQAISELQNQVVNSTKTIEAFTRELLLLNYLHAAKQCLCTIGTKVVNMETDQIGVVVCIIPTWFNKFDLEHNWYAYVYYLSDDGKGVLVSFSDFCEPCKFKKLDRMSYEVTTDWIKKSVKDPVIKDIQDDLKKQHLVISPELGYIRGEDDLIKQL